MKLSVIIPVYRGKKILYELIRRISNTLDKRFDHEILLISDGCDTESLKAINELARVNPDKINVFRLARNYGQHRALQYGFSKASGDLIVTLDEDLQHDPGDILKLVEKQKEGNFDIVYGRFSNPQHNGIRNVISSLLRKTLKHFIPDLYDNYSPYRLIKRDIASRITAMVSPYTFIDDFLSRITQNIGFVDISHSKRMEGKSSYTFRKLLMHGIFIFLAYSRIVSWLLIVSILIMTTGSILYITNIVRADYLNREFLNNLSIIEIFGTGLFFMVISLLGTLVNNRNMKMNKRPMKLFQDQEVL